MKQTRGIILTVLLLLLLAGSVTFWTNNVLKANDSPAVRSIQKPMQQQVSIPISSEPGVITYADKLGRTIRIQCPVRRAVLFHLYELIPALHCWDHVVGVGRFAYENDLMLNAKPDLQARIPSAGSGMDINIEALLKLKPDVVVTWTVKKENIKFMEEKGLKVIAVHPETVQELYDLIQLFGKMFECDPEARKVLRQMEDIIGMVKTRAARIPSNQRKRILAIGARPTTVAGGTGLTHEMIGLVGGVDAADGIAQPYATVSMETIIGWNPDVIFIGGMAKYTAQDILANPQWRFIKAVREGRVYRTPEWGPWSPRLALVVLWMAMQSHPELYPDIRFEKVADSFCREVFGIPFEKAGAHELQK